jgi:hypothetical protein
LVEEGGELSPERRRDAEARDRIDELKDRLDARYRRAFALVICGVAIVFAAIVFGMLVFQGQRWVSAREACERDNQRTQATVLLLNRLGASDATVRTTMLIFPHVPPLAHQGRGSAIVGVSPDYDGPTSCREYADERVGGPRINLE